MRWIPAVTAAALIGLTAVNWASEGGRAAAKAPAVVEPITMPAFASKVMLQNFGGAEPTEDGQAVNLYRLPTPVREAINETARQKYTQAAHSEIRFVLEEGEKLENVRIHLELPDKAQAFADYFCGDYQYFLYNRPIRRSTEVRFPTHGAYWARADRLPHGRFPNRLCRIVLRGGPLRLVGVEGNVRPPRADELPPVMVSYGTSITQGARASRPDLAYNALAARQLGYDLVNLGTSGSAFCEPEIAEYIAEQEWDLCLLSLSVNMVSRFSVEEFRSRASAFVDIVAAAHPDSPVVCISLFPYFADFDQGGELHAKAEAYRKTLEAVCEASERENVHFVAGPDLLDPTGLSQDMIHPSDHGMIRIARNLVRRIRDIQGRDD